MDFSLVGISLCRLYYILMEKSLFKIFGNTLRSLVFLFSRLAYFFNRSLVLKVIYRNYLFHSLLFPLRLLLLQIFRIYLRRLNVVIIDVFIIYRHYYSGLLAVILLNLRLLLLLLILHRLRLLLFLIHWNMLLLKLLLVLLSEFLSVFRVKL